MEIPQNVLDWLLEPKDPSVRYRTLRELLGEADTSPDVLEARSKIAESKRIVRIFSKMHPDGYWLHRGVGAGVSYAMSSSTHFVLSFLAELGMDRADPRVQKAVNRYLSLSEPDKPDPRPWEIPPDYRNHQSCLYAQNLRTFAMLGYGDDPRVVERKRVLLSDSRHDGGYLCRRPSFGESTKSCVRGTTKALMAYASFPDLWREESCRRVVDYFLNRNMIYRSDSPGTLIRDEVVSLSFPFLIPVSMLELVYAMSTMGYGKHAGMSDLWKRLEARRDSRGFFPVDRYPATLFTPGPKGKPNKWVTLYAYLALQRREGVTSQVRT